MARKYTRFYPRESDHRAAKRLMEELARVITSDSKGMHRYMTNSGYEFVRQEIADYCRKKQNFLSAKTISS